MNLKDKIYGSARIKYPVLKELINHPDVKRLEGVSQMGIMPPWHPYTFSRYEHCVGAMILLGRSGACLEEQIAGLLHDVSHTVFSHVTEWIAGDKVNEASQDKSHAEHIRTRTSILSVLNNYGVNERAALNPHAYKLLEQPAPRLCADRIDYTLRELFYRGEQYIAEYLAHSLLVVDGQFVFSSEDSAQVFFEAYNTLQEESWALPQTRAKYFLLANALKQALEDKTISEADLYTTDEQVLNKLSANPKAQEFIEVLNKGFELDLNERGVALQKKFRHVNPSFLSGGRIITVADVNPQYGVWLSEQQEKYKTPLAMAIIPR